MAGRTTRTTLTLDTETLALAEYVTRRLGISISVFASRAIRNEALRLGAPVYALDSDVDAIHDEAERAVMAAEEESPRGHAA